MVKFLLLVISQLNHVLREGETVQHTIEEELKKAAMADDSELHKLIDPEKINFEAHLVEAPAPAEGEAPPPAEGEAPPPPADGEAPPPPEGEAPPPPAEGEAPPAEGAPSEAPPADAPPADAPPAEAPAS